MSSEDKRPQVGVSMLIVKGDKVLLGKRKNSHGDGTWSAMGGHVEFGEDPIETAKREAKEETGIAVRDSMSLGYTNDFYEDEEKHYITLHFMGACKEEDEPTLLEPDKWVEFKWFGIHHLPEPLFLSTQAVIELYKQKTSP